MSISPISIVLHERFVFHVRRYQHCEYSSYMHCNQSLIQPQILVRDPRPSYISLPQQTLNLRRRFKWAFSSEYEALQSSDPVTPDFEGYQDWKAACLEEDETSARSRVREYFSRARNELRSLAGRGSDTIPSRLCAREYVQVRRASVNSFVSLM